MSSSPSAPHVQVVDSSTTLIDALDVISNVPRLYVDIEGPDLSRHGYLSILVIHVTTPGIVYLFDVLQMGKTTFTTSNTNNTTLQDLLQASTVLKVFFDVRNDSDALFAHYQVHLAGVHDVQLMELATRVGSKKYVAGLAKCVEKDSRVSYMEKAKWKRQKEEIRHLFNSHGSGSYEILNERPIQPGIVQYCVGDVVFLPDLYDLYDATLSTKWREKAEQATSTRIRFSHCPTYEPHATSKVLGPWADENPSDSLQASEHTDSMDDWDDWGETARDCIGWEEDMIRNGSPF